MDQSSVSEWIVRLRNSGDEDSAQQLWDRFNAGIRELANRWIRKMGTSAAFDEEDITISVFAAFCDRLQSGGLTQLTNRDELWRLLLMMTARKANDYAKNVRAMKRTHGNSQVDVEVGTISEPSDRRMEPSLEVMMIDQCQAMLKELADPELERVVLLKLEGFTNTEIASEMGYSRRTIQRMLNLVKDIWGRYVDQ